MPPLGEIELKNFCVPEYINASPSYLDGSLPGDVGFDPLCLVALARPTLSMDMDGRTAMQRHARMLSLTATEQQEDVMWMRESETKYARL